MSALQVLEIIGWIATPILAFVGSWGGIKASLQAMDRRITDLSNATSERMNGLSKRIDRNDDDIRAVERDLYRIGGVDRRANPIP